MSPLFTDASARPPLSGPYPSLQDRAIERGAGCPIQA
jgi:hypothetical protein